MLKYTESNTKISIAMACYNAEAFLRDAIESVAMQDHKNWQLVIADDASTDNSQKVIKECIKRLRIKTKTKVITLPKNKGYGTSLRTAITASKGELVAVLDSDDALSEKTVLRHVIAIHKKHPEAALTYSDYIECNSKLEASKVYHTRQIKDNEEYRTTKIRINHLKVFKRSFYNMTEGINPKLRQTVDKDLVLKLEEVGKLKHINDCLYCYRKHKKNISLTIDKQTLEYQREIATARHQIYANAQTRRSLQSHKWLDDEKCKALQTKWGLDYDEFTLNPNKSNKVEIIQALREAINKCDENSSILDVGCGAGHFLWVVKDSVSEMIGLDFSPGMLKLTEEQFKDVEIPLTLKHGSCWNLPFPDNSIDISYQIDVCMHVGGSWKAIKEMIRVSKRFIIFTGPSFDGKLKKHMNEIMKAGKSWRLSMPLLRGKLEGFKEAGLIKNYKFAYRQPTEVYKHRILIIEK